MPVINVLDERMIDARRPAWSKVTAAGIFRIPREGGRFDRHYHDCDEYWLVFRGRARVLSEDLEYLVGPGDIVCTQAGEEHDVLAVAEDLEAFFWEDVLPHGGQRGHLHRTPADKAGHDVATFAAGR
jgi:mannose-6-phosphate isomerase-like protein (cupin superfamily)